MFSEGCVKFISLNNLAVISETVFVSLLSLAFCWVGRFVNLFINLKVVVSYKRFVQVVTFVSFRFLCVAVCINAFQ